MRGTSKHLVRFIRIPLIIITVVAVTITVMNPGWILNDLPEKNFLQLMMVKSLVSECDTAGDCTPLEEPVDVEISTASGMLISSTGEYSYILTANHFCHREEYFYGSYISSDIDEFEIEIWAFDFSGSASSVTPVYVDNSSDLCLLSAKRKEGVNMKIAKMMPKLGEKVFAIAAPKGIHQRGVALHFEGSFSGCGSDDICFFTLPATFGSSGSLILNAGGEVVGMIQMVPGNFDSVSMGVGAETIRLFLRDAENHLHHDLGI